MQRIVNRLKAEATENRVKVLKAALVTTALVAAYYAGKDKGEVFLDLTFNNEAGAREAIARLRNVRK